jgi:hypothetical protein
MSKIIIEQQGDYIGQVKTSKELGVGDTHKWMWIRCPICNKEKWTRINRGVPMSNKCFGCGQTGRPPIDYHGATTLECKYCQQILPLSEFYKHNKSSRGYQTICKKCSSGYAEVYRYTENGKVARKRALDKYSQTPKGKSKYKELSNKYQEDGRYRERDKLYHKSDRCKANISKRANENKELPNTTTKVCSQCKRKLLLSEYFKNDWGKYGRKSKCKECTMSIIEAYENSEHGKKTMSAWIKSDEGKAAMARRSHRRRVAEKSVAATLTAEEWNVIKKRYKYRCVYCGEKKPLTRDHIIPVLQKGPLTKENVVPACASCNAKKHTSTVLLQILAMDKPTEEIYQT